MVKSTAEVTKYEFHAFNEVEDGAENVKLFEFKPLLTNAQTLDKSDFQRLIKNEREAAKGSSFKVNPIVEEYRGFKEQESREYEERVEEEVKRRLAEIQDEAFKVGFDEGVNQGREEVFVQMRSVVDQKLENFSQMITAVLTTQEDILAKQKTEMYLLLRTLAKWIVLRELKEDGKYIERLLEKLLLEMQVRSNLLIQVNTNDFSQMPEILEHVQGRLGEIKNVRIEMDAHVSVNGIVVESDNGIINASMEEQFKSLDKLFEDVLAKV
jgi:flagellar assembly protein FliH